MALREPYKGYVLQADPVRRAGRWTARVLIELHHGRSKLEVTAIFVTHDQDEALVMSDRIAVMNAGRIEHFGDPATVYARPATPFVLDFVGMACRFVGKV